MDSFQEQVIPKQELLIINQDGHCLKAKMPAICEVCPSCPVVQSQWQRNTREKGYNIVTCILDSVSFDFSCICPKCLMCVIILWGPLVGDDSPCFRVCRQCPLLSLRIFRQLSLPPETSLKSRTLHQDRSQGSSCLTVEDSDESTYLLPLESKVRQVIAALP